MHLALNQLLAMSCLCAVPAPPDVTCVHAGLPKTRSGKIMRRILRKIAAGQLDQLGDISTLAEPQVVEQLIQSRPQPKAARM